MLTNDKEYLMKICKNFEYLYVKFCAVSARYYDENRYLFANKDASLTEGNNNYNFNILVSSTSEEYVIKRVNLLIEFYILKELLSYLDEIEQNSYIDIIFTYIENIGLNLGFNSHSNLESYNNSNLKNIKDSLLKLKSKIEKSDSCNNELLLEWLSLAKVLIKERDCISIGFDGIKFASKVTRLKQSYWFVDYYKKYMFFGECIRILFLCYLSLRNNFNIENNNDDNNEKKELQTNNMLLIIDEYIESAKLWQVI